jgi:ABC-2 type transport system permease protein
VAAAFLRRDLLAAASYRVAFTGRLVAVIVSLWALGVTARFVGGGADVPGGFLGFWVLGVATAELFHACVTALPSRLRQAQLEGTLEAVLSTPARDTHVALAAGLYPMLAGCLRFAVYLAVALGFLGVPAPHPSIATLALVAPLAMATFLAVGLCAGAGTLILRRTDPVTALSWSAAAALGGVFYPVAALPAWLRPIGHWVPVAPALDGLRAGLYQGLGPGAAPVQSALARLAVFAAVALPIGAFAFARALRRARVDASLGQY